MFIIPCKSGSNVLAHWAGLNSCGSCKFENTSIGIIDNTSSCFSKVMSIYIYINILPIPIKLAGGCQCCRKVAKYKYKYKYNLTSINIPGTDICGGSFTGLVSNQLVIKYFLNVLNIKEIFTKFFSTTRLNIKLLFSRR